MGFKIEVWTRGLGVYLVVGAVGMGQVAHRQLGREMDLGRAGVDRLGKAVGGGGCTCKVES